MLLLLRWDPAFAGCIGEIQQNFGLTGGKALKLGTNIAKVKSKESTI